eukprot:322820_1
MEQKVQRLCLFWKYQPGKIKQNWRDVKKSIDKLEAKYSDSMDVDNSNSNSDGNNNSKTYVFGVLFQTYVTSMMVAAKKAFINKVREIVIEYEYRNIQWNGIGVTENQVGSIGGATVNSLIRQLRCRNVLQKTRKLKMPFVKYLMSSDCNDPLIPQELKYKNTGGMRLLSPMFYPVSREILEHVQCDINKARVLGGHFDLKSLVENVINNPKYLQTFYLLYSTIDPNGCIPSIYHKYSRGIVSRFASAILTDEQYSFDSIQFRTHLHAFDIKNQKRTSNNPLGLC